MKSNQIRQRSRFWCRIVRRLHQGKRVTEIARDLGVPTKTVLAVQVLERKRD